MISRSRLHLQIRRSKLKVKVREMSKNELDYLGKLFSREARYTARMTGDMFCNQISFATNAVSVVDSDIAYYLLFCVGYADIRPILKSVRRYVRKNRRGALK